MVSLDRVRERSLTENLVCRGESRSVYVDMMAVYLPELIL